MSGRGAARRSAALVPARFWALCWALFWALFSAPFWALGFAGCGADEGGAPAAPTPPAPGATVVTANASGGSTTRLNLVAAQEVESPRVIGAIPPAVLVQGARGLHWSLDAVFEPAGFAVEVESQDEAVVVAEGVDEFGSLTLAPVGPGATTVVVTARNDAGHADAMMEVEVLDKLRIGLVSRVQAASGGAPIRLAEGARLSLEVRPRQRALAAHAAESVTLQIVVEGPEGQVELPQAVTAGRLGHLDERTAFTVEALRDDAAGEEEAAYSISLAPDAEGLPAWMEIVTDPVSLVVADSPAADCAQLAVDAGIRQRTGGRVRGDFVIQAPHPDTVVSFTSPYVERPRQAAVWRTAAAHLFPEGLGYREMPVGFEQTVRLSWWDEDLVFIVEAPGCEPLQVVCDDTRCEVE